MLTKNSGRNLALIVIGLLLTGLSSLEVNAQLLEERNNRLKSVRGTRPGFLFFQRKIKTSSPKDTQKPDFKVSHPKSELPANYNKNPKPVKVRTSAPVSYNKKKYRTFIRTSTPVSYNKKDQKVKVRTSTPVSYNKKDHRVAPRTSFPVSYNQKEHRVKVRYTKPIKDTYFNFWITQQQKSRRRLGPPGDPSGNYNKSRLSFKSPFVYRRKISLSGPMNFRIKKREIDMDRPDNVTNNYRGDVKRDRNPILHIKYRIGQWERSSYRGHHVDWNKSAKRANDQVNSQTISRFDGDSKTLVPFLANLKEKMRLWEQTHYQGRSDGWSKFGRQDYYRQKALLVTNFEGEIKIKRHKGKDMHPSIAYISGKKFHSSKWKERWRKLNIVWFRVNSGKEVPGGAKEKYKEKYDKEERDLWTY